MKKNGFTLIEILAVIAILAILAIIVVPNVIKLYSNATNEVFITETKNLLKEADNQFTSDIISNNNPSYIYCNSENDSINSLNMNGEEMYYYIKKDSKSNTQIFVVWNSHQYIKIIDNNGVDITTVSKDDINELDVSNLTCSNVLAQLNIIPVVNVSNLSIVLYVDSNYSDDYNHVNMKINNSSSETNLNTITYKIYGKRTNESTYTYVGDLISSNKANNYNETYDVSAVNYISGQGYISYDYKVEAYTEYEKILEKTVTFELCFVRGTKVLTEDGYKNIEEISEGQKVYTYNLDTNELELKKVLKIIKSNAIQTYKMTIGTQTVEMSVKHQLYIIDKGWLRAYDVKVGDKMLKSNNEVVTIDNIELINYEQPIDTYNLSVDGNNNFFVTNIQVLVHNVGSPS